MVSFSYSVLTSILHEHSTLFFIAILSIAMTVGLKSLKVFIIQFIYSLILLSSFAFTGAKMLSIVLAAIQVLFFLFLIYKIKKAVDYEHTLVIEKTHIIPRKITREGNLGTKNTFF